MKFQKILIIALLLLLVGLSLLSAYYWLNHGPIEESLRKQLIASLDKWTGGKSSVGALTVHFFPPRLLITHLRIDTQENSLGSPLLSIPVVELRPRWRDLWLFSFQIQRLRIVEPSIHLGFGVNGSKNIPIRGGTLDPFLMQIHHLSIENGNIQINEKNLAWNVEVEGAHLSADRPMTRESYLTQFGYRKGTVRWGKVTLTGGLDVTCEWLHDTIKLQRLVMTTNNSGLEAEGVLENLASPRGTLIYRGHLQVSDIHPFAPQLPDVKGLLNLQGQFEFSPDSWRSEGKLEGQKLSMKLSQVDRLSCDFALNSKQFDFQKIQLEGLKGHAAGSLRVDDPFHALLFTTALTLNGIDLSGLAQVAGLSTITPTGQIQGSLRATWRGPGKDFNGEGHLKILPGPDHIDRQTSSAAVLPISGELNFSANDTSLLFQNTQLQLKQSRLKLEGNISPGGDSKVGLEFHSENLGEIGFLIPDLRGEASFEGSIQGKRQAPRLEGQFLLHHLAFGNYQADEVKGALQANALEIQLDHTTLNKASSLVSLKGRLPLNPSTRLPNGDIDLEVHAYNSLAEDLIAMIGRNFPISGRINGELRLKGNFRQPIIDGHLVLSNGQFLQQPFDKANVTIEYQDPVLNVPAFTLRIGSGHLTGAAQINLQEQTVHSSMKGSDLHLEQLPWVHPEKTKVNGSLQGISLEAEGPFRRPALKGQFELKTLTVAGENAGDYLLHVDTTNQVSSFTITSMNPDIQLNAEGTVELNENLSLKAQLTFNNLILTPYVMKFLPVVPEKLSSQAAGQVTVTGPLSKPEEITVNGFLQSMKIQFREAQLQSAKSFEIAVSGEKATIRNAEFTGKGTVLTLNGSIDLAGKGQLNLGMKGEFDLALLNEFIKSLTASGSGTVNAQVRGTLHDPRIHGQGKVTNAQIAYAGFPNSLSQTNGTLFFDENQIRIENITGTSGGGKITTTGNLLFGEEKIKMLNLRIQGHEVRIRYPEGMRNVVDADLALRGSQQSQVLSGNIRVLSASFQKGYDPLTQFLENRSKSVNWPGAKDFGNELHLDLTVSGDRNIKLDTPLIRTSARADLKVKGTAGRPFVTGSLEANEGEVFFQGVRYRLTRGRVEFLNPVRIDPRIDLEAEGDVRDYRIVLNLSGTLDKLRANIRSDPPLPTVDIFNLVAMGGSSKSGVTSSSYRPNTTGGTQQDSSSGASALLSEGLSLKMGSRVKRIFGLDSFRVDPLLIGNERDPTTRVTMGQQVTKNLAITYSTNVSNNEQQVIYIEYFLNESTTVIGSRDIDGAFGLDIRFRKRLRHKNQ